MACSQQLLGTGWTAPLANVHPVSVPAPVDQASCAPALLLDESRACRPSFVQPPTKIVQSRSCQATHEPRTEVWAPFSPQPLNCLTDAVVAAEPSSTYAVEPSWVTPVGHFGSYSACAAPNHTAPNHTAPRSSNAASAVARWTGARSVVWRIWVRQLKPSASTIASSLSRMAGSSSCSAHAIDTS